VDTFQLAPTPPPANQAGHYLRTPSSEFGLQIHSLVASTTIPLLGEYCCRHGCRLSVCRFLLPVVSHSSCCTYSRCDSCSSLPTSLWGLQFTLPVIRCIVCEKMCPGYLRLCPIKYHDGDAKLLGKIVRFSHLHCRFSSPVVASFGRGGFEVVGTSL